MALRGKDIAATVLTAVAVLIFAATQQGWNVWLVGGSHRWAAAAIMLVGVFTCGLGSPSRSASPKTLSVLGTIALVLGVVSIVTGSMTALWFLIADFVVLWAVSTAAHVRHAGHAPMHA